MLFNSLNRLSKSNVNKAILDFFSIVPRFCDRKFLLRLLPFCYFARMKPEEGYEEATSVNLPYVDLDMVMHFYATNPNFQCAELRGVKAMR